MLYDKRWDKEIKADPFSLESLISWLEKQPADADYDYCDPFNCLLCQYFRGIGMEIHSVAYRSVYFDDGPKGTHFPMVLHDVSQGDDAEWTFGKALERAREALSVTSKERETR